MNAATCTAVTVFASHATRMATYAGVNRNTIRPTITAVVGLGCATPMEIVVTTNTRVTNGTRIGTTIERGNSQIRREKPAAAF